MSLPWPISSLVDFIFQKLARMGWRKWEEKYGPPPLTFELPQPVNPMGRSGSGGYITPGWSVCLRFIVNGPHRDILELHIEEDEVGSWQIDEVFSEHIGRPVPFPIRISPTAEFWIRARSPRSHQSLPIQVGRLTLRVRDNTQPPGQFHAFPMPQPPTSLLIPN